MGSDDETTEPAGRPLRRDAERNRRRLLDAARAVFAERGLGVTLDDIAERAGVGVGTAYRRFANKDEVIAAVAEDRIVRVSEVLDRALAEPDPWLGIVVYLEQWLEMHAGDRGLKEMFLASPRYREADQSAQKHLRPRLDDLVARAKRAGVLRPGIETTDIVLSQLMLSALPVGDEEDGTTTWRRFLPLVLDGLKAGDGRPLPGRALRLDQLDHAIRISYGSRRQP
jgi:AcrR family transcriptional regulator